MRIKSNFSNGITSILPSSGVHRHQFSTLSRQLRNFMREEALIFKNSSRNTNRGFKQDLCLQMQINRGIKCRWPSRPSGSQWSKGTCNLRILPNVIKFKPNWSWLRTIWGKCSRCKWLRTRSLRGWINGSRLRVGSRSNSMKLDLDVLSTTIGSSWND